VRFLKKITKKITKGVKKLFKKPLRLFALGSAVALPFLAPKLGLGALASGGLGKIAGVLRGSALSKLGLGALVSGGLGALAGGGLGKIAGVLGGSALLSYLLSGGRTKDDVIFSSYTPPHALYGVDVISSLLKKTPTIASEITELKKPYIDQAIRSAEEMEGKVAGLYDTLLSQTKDMINRETTKQATRLGALGLANTQAMQWTTADILDKTKLPIIREKTRFLSQLTMTKPQLFAELADLATQKSSKLLEYEMSKDLAKALFGVPSVVQPKIKHGMTHYFPSIANTLLLASLLSGGGKSLSGGGV